jgi:hypothetical protein
VFIRKASWTPSVYPTGASLPRSAVNLIRKARQAAVRLFDMVDQNFLRIIYRTSSVLHLKKLLQYYLFMELLRCCL